MKPHSRFVTAARAADGAAWRVALKAIADAGGKAVTLLVMVLAARALSAEAFGVLAVATTAGWLLGIATDAGWSMHLARAVARRRGPWRSVFAQVLRIRAASAYTAVAIAALASGRMVPPDQRTAFLLLVTAQLTSAVLETAAHLFRGLGRSEIESAIHAAQRGLTGALAAAVLIATPRLDLLGWAMLLPPAAGLMAAVVIAWRLGDRDGEASRPAPLAWPDFQRDVLPLGAAALVSALYFRCDLFFVERWHGLDAAGAYNAVFRLVEAVRLLPAAILAVTFPRLCRAESLAPVTRLGSGLAAAGALAAAALVPLAPLVVTRVYGAAFAAAAPALAVLALALPLFFLNYALTHQVIGWDGQRAYLRIAVTALAANVAANLLLVPRFGAVGAATATVLTEVVVTSGCVVALWGALPLGAAAGAEGHVS